MRLLSIDPGKAGAICYWEDGKVMDVFDIMQKPWGSKQFIPDPDMVRDIIDNLDPDVIVIERVTSSPRAGVSSTGIFLQGFGILIGCCAGYRVEFIRPQIWKSAAGLSGKLAKIASVDKAVLKHPECEAMVRDHKNSIDRADAILIGHAFLLLNREVK